MMPRSPSNNRVKVRMDARDRRLARAEILDNAIPEYPYLIRKIDGEIRLGDHTCKYRFRPIAAPMCEAILESI